MGVTKDDEKKEPTLYKLYDFTNGGTGECDQKVESYSVKPKSRKWTIGVFSYILDMTSINAKTVLLLNKKENPRARDTSAFMFSFKISKTLSIQFIETRSVNGLSHTVIDKMNMLQEKNVNDQLAQFQMNNLHQNKDAGPV